VPLYEYRCADCSAETERLVRVAAEQPPLKCDQCGSTRMDRRLAGFAIGRSELDKVQALDPKYRQMVDDESRKTSYADPMKHLEKMIPFDAVDDPGDPIDF
jgi:putative FmdB family regulatory protein